MKKFIINAILGAILLTLNLAVLPATYAGEAEDSLSEATFDVRDILKLPGEDQPAAYFNNPTDPNAPKYSPIVKLIIRIIDFATQIIGSIAIILFIVSGFIYILSTGNQQTLDKAKDIALYAIIGLVVTFFSYVIAIFIQSIFLQTPPAT